MNNDHQTSRLDNAFSHFLVQRTSLSKKQKETFEDLIKRLSFQQSQGHSCIPLDAKEQELILASGLAAKSLSTENHLSPLIVEQNRLYLHRYWFYENRLAKQITGLLSQCSLADGLQAILDRYYTASTEEIDWQKEAVKKAVNQTFCIISGGPGTGKTTTVVKILAILQELASQDNRYLHIALVAPTGKAAMRLQEAVGFSKNTLPCSEIIKQQIPESVTTLHCLLGSQVPSAYFKHDSMNPLVYDLVVVDETSMVDLALMSKLLDALKPGSRLILLGDKDQLASVESGAVLADLTAALPEYTVELKKSFRFKGEIKQLADAVNFQDAEKAWKILEKGQQVSLLEQDLINYITEQYNHYWQKISNNDDFAVIFYTFNQFQVLCSNRYGEYGVYDINEKVEKKLTAQNKIKMSEQWYLGRPVMVTQNNTVMQLFNGDIGICLYDKTKSAKRIFFLQSNGVIKKILPSRMPAHETVYAMTIHKCQGSEFDECLCVLADKISPVLTKELVYTAITRAKTKLKILSSYSIFCQTIGYKVERTSGLLEKLNKLK